MGKAPAFRRALDALGPGRATIAARAPGRVNIIGEHTDYNDGLVMPAAIQLDCVAVAAPARSGLELIAADLGESVTLGDDETITPEHPLASRGRWTSYALGVIAHFTRSLSRSMRMPNAPSAHSPGLIPPMRIALACDVPPGAGLSSSAALEVALCTLLHAGVGRSADEIASLALETADACRRAEHGFAGVPCGPMDQVVSACARAGHALHIDCRDLSLSHIAIPSDAAFVVCDSGVRHALADGAYAARRSACARAARAMGVPSLRDATIESLRSARTLSEEERRCARHVIGENARVRECALALARGDLASAGRAMDASHDSIAHDFRVSCDELDGLVRSARSTPGVLGSRMTGAGFGGSTVTLCARADAPRVLEALSRASRDISAASRPPFIVEPAQGARRIDPASGEALA